MNNKLKLFFVSTLITSMILLLINTSALNISDESIVDIEMINPRYTLSSSYSGDILIALRDMSVARLSNSNIWVNTNEVMTTNGILITSAKICINDYSADGSEEAREYYTNKHGINIREAWEDSGLGTYSYNCHAYAWYGISDDNKYWIDDPSEFFEDVHCQELEDESELQEGDIIVFWNGGVAVHSAKVYSIYYDIFTHDYDIECISKCGPQGVYIHSYEYTEILYPHEEISFYRYTQGQHDLYMVEDNGEDGCTIGCKAEKIIDGQLITCPYTYECYELVDYTSDGSSGHYISCQDNCFSMFAEHEYCVDTILDSFHVLRCQLCNHTEYVQHDFYIYEIVDDYSCNVKCQICDYLTNTFAPYYQNYGESGHHVEITGVLSYFEEHTLYMYSADTEDYTVKCRDCNYSVRCVESPEYYGTDGTGHWVDCPDGCYSLFEAHTPESYTETDGSSHEVVCADCGYTYYEDHNYGDCYCTSNANYHYYECEDCGYYYSQVHIFNRSATDSLFTHLVQCTLCDYESIESHTWVSYGMMYKCTDCGMISDSYPGIMSLPDPELEAYLASLSEEELDLFLASLPEEDLSRITALLPPENDDELLTE